MTALHSVIFGIVQGLTEPLPVSSSAHLLLVRQWLGVREGGLAFDTALHVGTGLALLVFFRKEWLALLPQKHAGNWQSGLFSSRLLSVLLGILPAGVAGLLFEDLVEHYLRSPWVAAIALAGVGVLMWIASVRADRAGPNFTVPASDTGSAQSLPSAGSQPELKKLGKALKIGLFQILALVPGVSRSGITISAGLLFGLSQTEAFNFSFLMGAPLTLGAGAFQLVKLYASPVPVDWFSFAVGIVTSLVVGLSALWLFRRIFTRFNLKPFVIYRLLLASAITFSILL